MKLLINNILFKLSTAILFKLDFAIPSGNMYTLCQTYWFFCKQVPSPNWNCFVLQCWWFVSHEKKILLLCMGNVKGSLTNILIYLVRLIYNKLIRKILNNIHIIIIFCWVVYHMLVIMIFEYFIT
jgi:hypothetical protein